MPGLSNEHGALPVAASKGEVDDSAGSDPPSYSRPHPVTVERTRVAGVLDEEADDHTAGEVGKGSGASGGDWAGWHEPVPEDPAGRERVRSKLTTVQARMLTRPMNPNPSVR